MVFDLLYWFFCVYQLIFDKVYGLEFVNCFFDVIMVQKMSLMFLFDGFGVVFGVIIGMVVFVFYYLILFVFDLLIVIVVIGIVFIFGCIGIQSVIKEFKIKYVVVSWFEDIV